MSKSRTDKAAMNFQEMSDYGLISLKADFKNEQVKKALKVLSVRFPEKGKILFGNDLSTAWMAPDEMAVIARYKSAHNEIKKIKRSFKGIPSLCANMSDSRRSFVITGARWREILATGTPIDLSLDTFSLGDFRRTRIGGLAVAIWMINDFAVQVMCMTSVGDFLENWLRNALAHDDIQKYF